MAAMVGEKHEDIAHILADGLDAAQLEKLAALLLTSGLWCRLDGGVPRFFTFALCVTECRSLPNERQHHQDFASVQYVRAI